MLIAGQYKKWKDDPVLTTVGTTGYPVRTRLNIESNTVQGQIFLQLCVYVQYNSSDTYRVGLGTVNRLT